MFTGIVKGTATVDRIVDDGGIRQLTLRFPEGALDQVAIGASVAIAGTCLSVVEASPNTARFDVIGETLRLTTLGGLKVGDTANFERSLVFGSEIGGHVLSGHILAAAEVIDRREEANNLTLTFRSPEAARPYLFEKGFVALDGCSLTLAQVGDDQFSVHLIPETRRITTFDGLQPGDKVNLEVDASTQATVDTVNRVLKQMGTLPS